MPGDAVLVVGPSWVGDMVMAQSLFKTLKLRQPDRAVDVLAPAWSLPIVARMPEVREGIALHTGHGELGFGKRRQAARQLKSKGYKKAIVLPRSLKAALVPWFADIPVRTGFRGESRFILINDTRPFDKNVLDQTVKRFVALGLEPGEDLPALPNPALQVDPQKQKTVVDKLGLDISRPIVAMMPGAEYGPAKCWPLAYFHEVAKALDEQGVSVWVLGSDKDRVAGEQIAAGGHAVNLCGRTSLEDVIDLLALAGQVISNDSGLLHVAAAVGCHVQALYGSSSPAFTPPLTDNKTIHHLGLDCSPCFKRECPLGHLNCLVGIKPDAVMESIETANGR